MQFSWNSVDIGVRYGNNWYFLAYLRCFKGSQTEIAPLVVRFLFCESEYDRFHALARLGEMYFHLIYFVISADITRWPHDIFDNIEIWSITCIVAMRLTHVSSLGCLMQKNWFPLDRWNMSNAPDYFPNFSAWNVDFSFDDLSCVNRSWEFHWNARNTLIAVNFPFSNTVFFN